MHFYSDSQTPSPMGKGWAAEAPPGSTVLLIHGRGPFPAIPSAALGQVMWKFALHHCSERCF